MPGVSGVDIGRYVKSLPEPRPRVIAMSASPLPAEELAIFDDFVPKPVDQDLLRAAIAGSSTTPHAAKLPPSLDSSIVTKLQAIMAPPAIHELYTVYVADTRKRIHELERYSAEGDEESLRRCAHARKRLRRHGGSARHSYHCSGTRSGRPAAPGSPKVISRNAQRL